MEPDKRVATGGVSVCNTHCIARSSVLCSVLVDASSKPCAKSVGSAKFCNIVIMNLSMVFSRVQGTSQFGRPRASALICFNRVNSHSDQLNKRWVGKGLAPSTPSERKERLLFSFLKNRLSPSYLRVLLPSPFGLLSFLIYIVRRKSGQVRVLDNVCVDLAVGKGWTAAAPPRVQKHAVNRTWKRLISHTHHTAWR